MIQFRIDERLLARCDERNHAELMAVLECLNEGQEPVILQPARAPDANTLIRLVVRSTGAITFELREPGVAEPLHSHRLLWTRLTKPIKEYRHVIMQMAESGRVAPPDHLEVLDLAKKVIHNEAGESLIRLLDAFVTIDLDTARNLFTLLFLIKTGLPANVVRYHRTHLG